MTRDDFDNLIAASCPRGDRVVVRRDPTEYKTAGNILLPDNAGVRPQLATVIAVGPGRTLDNGLLLPTNLSPGDRVLMTCFAGAELLDPVNTTVDTSRYLILREDDILASVPKELAPIPPEPGVLDPLLEEVNGRIREMLAIEGGMTRSSLLDARSYFVEKVGREPLTLQVTQEQFDEIQAWQPNMRLMSVCGLAVSIGTVLVME